MDHATPTSFPNGLWAWGIDLSSVKIAFAAKRGAQFRTHLRLLPRKGRSLLSQLERVERSVAADAFTLARTCPPGLIVIEEPFGRGNKTTLTTVLAATMLGLHHGLNNQFGPPNIELVTASQWKKAVIGKGNADKDLCMLYARIFFRRELGDQDLADALCIATYAQEREIQWS